MDWKLVAASLMEQSWEIGQSVIDAERDPALRHRKDMIERGLTTSMMLDKVSRAIHRGATGQAFDDRAFGGAIARRVENGSWGDWWKD